MKIVGKIIKLVITLGIIGGLGYLGFQYYQSRQANNETTAVSYSRIPVTQGDLQKTVTGTGSLSISEKRKVSLDFDVQLDEILVQSGEQVSVGSPLAKVNADALSETIETLTTEIAELDSSLATSGSAYEDTAYVKASIAGRVKEIYGQKGMLVQEVVDEFGGVALLSVDEMMQVVIHTDLLSVGETVKVIDGRNKYNGSVEKVTNGEATVTFPDTKTLKGASVIVTKDDVKIGEGTAEIHLPYMCSSTTEGYISSVYPSVNTSISKNSKLLYITNIPKTSEYTSLLKQRDEKLLILNKAKQIQLSGVIVSPVDGIINTISEASIDGIMAKSEIASIYVGDKMQMIISVDELDINGVQVGQASNIAMDSVPDKTYSATVSYISQIGTSSSGVTNYSVTLNVDGDVSLKMGMNGTATIVVDEVENVLLVPITALYSSREGQYVWLQSDEALAGSPGIRTTVETGFSNDTYAEVKSGLNLDDVVLVLRSESDNASNAFGMMNFGTTTMMTMPADGGAPMNIPSVDIENRGNGNSGDRRPNN